MGAATFFWGGLSVRSLDLMKESVAENLLGHIEKMLYAVRRYIVFFRHEFELLACLVLALWANCE